MRKIEVGAKELRAIMRLIDAALWSGTAKLSPSERAALVTFAARIGLTIDTASLHHLEHQKKAEPHKPEAQ